MQTIPVNQTDPKHTMRVAQHSPATRNEPLPVAILTAPAPGKSVLPATATRVNAQQSAISEMDAMLIRDPNVGAVHGIRIALLFNAGLALSGLVVWELWSLL